MKHAINFFLITILFFLIGNKQTLAQNKIRSIELAAGVSHLRILDENFSLMMHKGTMFSPLVSFGKETDKYLDITNLQFQKGKIYLGTTGKDNPIFTKIISGTIDWVHLRKITIKDTPRYQFLIGGVLNSSFTYYNRDLNNQIPLDDDNYYLYQSSLGPAFHLRSPFTIEDITCYFETQLNFALLAYAVYPSYSSEIPDRKLEKSVDELRVRDFIFGGKVLAINKFQRINYNASFTAPLNSNTYFKLSYNWELINICKNSNLTKANHQLFLSLIFKY